MGGLHEDSVGETKRSESPFCVAGWNITQHSVCVGKQQPEQLCLDLLWQNLGQQQCRGGECNEDDDIG